MKYLQNVFVISCVAFCMGAHSAPLKKIKSSQLSTLKFTGDLSLLQTALTRQLAQCKTENAKDTFLFANQSVTRSQWCLKTGNKLIALVAKFPNPYDFWREVQKEFVWYQSTGSDGLGKVLYTSYYAPSMDVKLVPDQDFKYPLYRAPTDLVAGTPYLTHEEIIGKNKLAGRGLEIAYTKDYFENFIFQVQGAGAIHILDAGTGPARKVLNYAAGNGQKYLSVGKVLRDEYGLPEAQLNLPGMRNWFLVHPDKMMEVLFRSPSFVFFKEDVDGPYGVKNIVLTPKSSFASDQSLFPLGSVALVVTEIPTVDSATGALTWTPHATLAVNQDVGGAIKGAGRVDLYWGEGKQAEETAGYMNRHGLLFFLVAK